MLQRMQVPNNALECQTTPLDVEAETSMLNDEVDRDKVINGVQLYLLPDTECSHPLLIRLLEKLVTKLMT